MTSRRGTREKLYKQYPQKFHISYSQPWCTRALLIPDKAAASYHFSRVAWSMLNCARQTI